jgi:hypothetical protein
MNSLDVPLIVQLLVLVHKLPHESVSEECLVSSDLALVQNSEAGNELTEVSKVLIGEDVVESARSEDIHIDEEFPCFIPTRDLLRWIPRCHVE